MRELTVYYCKKCGRYGFYQIPRNAVCPVCGLAMTVFPMAYQSFMDLDYQMRNQMISDQIAGEVAPQTSVIQRITEPTKAADNRTELARLMAERETMELELQDLSQKNQELENTIHWMHDMIWDLTRKLHGDSNS